MNNDDGLVFFNQATWSLLAIVVHVTLISLLTLIAARCLKSRGSAWRHAILLSGLLAVAVLPCAVWIMQSAKFKTIRLDSTVDKLGLYELMAEPVRRLDRFENIPPITKDFPAPETEAQPQPSDPPEPQPIANPPRSVEHRTWAMTASQVLIALFGVWIVGMILLTMDFVRGVIAARRILCECRPCADGECLAAWQAALNTLKRVNRPRLLRSSTVVSPMVIGIFRPAVVLPHGLEKARTSGELRNILLHELAHIVRSDTLTGLVQRLIGIVWWPHPLVARLNRQLSQAREEVCDNYVLQHAEKHEYARTLLDLACAAPDQTRLVSTAGLLESRWPLEARIRDLLDDRRRLDLHLRRLPALMIVGLMCACTFFLAGAAGPPLTPEEVLDELRSLGARISGLPGEQGGTARVSISDEWHGKANDLLLLKRLKGLKEVDFSGLRNDELLLEDLPDLERFSMPTMEFFDDALQRKFRGSPIKTVRLNNLPKIKEISQRAGFNNLSSTQMTRLELVDMDQLVELQVVGNQLTDDVVRGIAGAPNLKSVGLSISSQAVPGMRTEITDAGLNAFTGLKQLTSLGLSGAYISDAGVKTLSKVSTLENLDLSATDITDQCLDDLARLTKLISLGITDTAISDVGLERIVKEFPAMEGLWVGGAAITAKGLTALKGLPQLNRVCVSASQLSEESCAVLNALPMPFFTIIGKSRTPGRLSGFPKLVMLYIEGAGTLTVADGSLKGLKTLYLRGAEPTTIKSLLRNSRSMNQLSYLEISEGRDDSGEWDPEYSAPINDDLMQEVSHFQNLEQIHIGGPMLEIGDKGVAVLAGLKSLQTIRLHETRATDQSVAELAKLPKLTRLQIGGAEISDEVLPHFKNCKTLRELILINSSVTAEGVRWLQSELPDATIQLSGSRR